MKPIWTTIENEKSDVVTVDQKTAVNEIIVIKIGGSTLSTDEALHTVLNDIKDIVASGKKVILVHGGGPAISEEIKKQGNPCHFVDGLRVTDESCLSIAKAVLNDLNHQIVEHLKGQSIDACSVDTDASPIMVARKKLVTCKSGTQLDIGFVGEISTVDGAAVLDLLDHGKVPVFVSMAADVNGQLYNVNADNVAMSIAVAVSATQLIYVTDVPGIMMDQGVVLHEVDLDQIGVLIDSGIIKGGMIPKVRSCAAGIKKGIGSVTIGQVDAPGALLDAVMHPGISGTVIAGTKMIA